MKHVVAIFDGDENKGNLTARFGPNSITFELSYHGQPSDIELQRLLMSVFHQSLLREIVGSRGRTLGGSSIAQLRITFASLLSLPLRLAAEKKPS